MMRFMLGAYWGARPDELGKCTEDAQRLFSGLAEIDPLLAHWYEPGNSRKDFLKRKVEARDIGRLRDLLLKGRNRRDVGHEVIDELGFSLDLWNGAGEKEAEASVRILCGCYNERIPNKVLIQLPHNAKSPQWVGNASSLLALVAEIWRPKWAGIMSKKAMSERDYNARHPFVDWMVYVPRPVQAMPLPSRVEVLEGLGSIVIVRPDPPVGDDAEELSLVRGVEKRLAD